MSIVLKLVIIFLIGKKFRIFSQILDKPVPASLVNCRASTCSLSGVEPSSSTLARYPESGSTWLPGGRTVPSGEVTCISTDSGPVGSVPAWEDCSGFILTIPLIVGSKLSSVSLVRASVSETTKTKSWLVSVFSPKLMDPQHFGFLDSNPQIFVDPRIRIQHNQP